MKLRRSGISVALFTTALFFATAAAAIADNATPLGGSPLNVYVGERGQLQAVRTDSSSGIFFRPSSTVGDAGFFLAFPSGFAGEPAPTVWGFEGFAGPHGLEEFTPVSQSPVSGSGSAADPLKQVTHLHATRSLTVTQTTTYVNGSQEFRVHWEVNNNSGAAINFKALAAADFYFQGDDAGTGIFTAGPPRFIGGTNLDTGSSGGFAEVTGGGLDRGRPTRPSATAAHRTRSGAKSRNRPPPRRRPSTTRCSPKRSTTPAASSGTRTRPERASPRRDPLLRAVWSEARSPRRCSSTRPTRPRARACRSTSRRPPSTATASPTPAKRIRYSIVGPNADDRQRHARRGRLAP